MVFHAAWLAIEPVSKAPSPLIQPIAPRMSATVAFRSPVIWAAAPQPGSGIADGLARWGLWHPVGSEMGCGRHRSLGM